MTKLTKNSEIIVKHSWILQKVKEQVFEKRLNFTGSRKGVLGTFFVQQYLGNLISDTI